jgi:hypothetical protein
MPNTVKLSKQAPPPPGAPPPPAVTTPRPEPDQRAEVCAEADARRLAGTLGRLRPSEAVWAAPNASPDCRILTRWVARQVLCSAITRSALAADPVYQRILLQLRRTGAAGTCIADIVHLERRQIHRIHALHEEVLDLLHDMLPEDPREDGASDCSSEPPSLRADSSSDLGGATSPLFSAEPGNGLRPGARHGLRPGAKASWGRHGLRPGAKASWGRPLSPISAL